MLDFIDATLGLIEEEYETLEDGILALSEVSDIEPEEVISILDGTYIPDVEVAEVFAQAFEACEDDDTYLGYLATAQYTQEVMEEELAELEAELEEYDEDEDEYEEDEDEYVTDEYDEDEDEEDWDEEELTNSLIAQEFSSQQSRINQLENTLSEFNYNSTVNTYLEDLMGYADALIADSKMYAVEKALLFGDLDEFSPTDRLSYFSAACAEDNISPDVYLYGLNMCLQMIGQRGEIFPESFVNKEMALFSANEEDLDEQAVNDVFYLLN